MAGKLREGTPADIVILTAALIADLARENLVASASISRRRPGRNGAGRARRRSPCYRSMMRQACAMRCLALTRSLFPIPKSSTAGIHVAKVLQQLGIADAVAARLKIHPNGATAMRHLAESNAARPIGCTQSTEIINTEGAKLSGSLPRGCDLSTLYTAAIATAASHARQAQVLIDLLTNRDQRELRTRAGFLDARN